MRLKIITCLALYQYPCVGHAREYPLPLEVHGAAVITSSKKYPYPSRWGYFSLTTPPPLWKFQFNFMLSFTNLKLPPFFNFCQLSFGWVLIFVQLKLLCKTHSALVSERTNNRCVKLSFPHLFSQIEIQKKKLSLADFKFKIEQIAIQLKIPVQVRLD